MGSDVNAHGRGPIVNGIEECARASASVDVLNDLLFYRYRVLLGKKENQFICPWLCFNKCPSSILGVCDANQSLLTATNAACNTKESVGLNTASRMVWPEIAGKRRFRPFCPVCLSI
jgi:hypothetical protein